MSERLSDSLPESTQLAGDITSVSGIESGLIRSKEPTHHANLRIGRVEICHILAIDLAELVRDREHDRRILHRLRAKDEFFERVKVGLIGRIPECVSDAERHIRPRMVQSVKLRGKAVWTEYFIDKFAPILLPAPSAITHNGNDVVPDKRLSDDWHSPLHFVRFQGAFMKMFRDGTITYTVRTTFADHVSSRHGGRKNPPASIRDAIGRMEAMDGLLAESFRKALSDLTRPEMFRDTMRECARVSDAEKGLELIASGSLTADELGRRSKEHRVIFVESFFDGERAEQLVADGCEDLTPARVDLPIVLASSSLAGLLNTASWYDRYNARYVLSLGEKEIGYRKDEIYLTDSKATVISASGFWGSEQVDGSMADPLSLYKWDIILAVEYNLARLAYFSSTLAYYQGHPDVQGLEDKNPLTALAHVIDGRSVLSHIEESLDLSLLIDHGFTRVFIQRLREELGFATSVGFIRRRVEDASTSVGLKSSVLAAENTSKESLKAAIANNELQRTIGYWTRIAVAVAVGLFLISQVLQMLS